MHYMPYNMHNMQNVNMQNNMQIDMQTMLAICRFGADCLVLTVICRICQIICTICIICYVDFQYAQYAFPTLLMIMTRISPRLWYHMTQGFKFRWWVPWPCLGPRLTDRVAGPGPGRPAARSTASGTCRNGIYLVYTWYIPGIDQHRRYRSYIGGIYHV